MSGSVGLAIRMSGRAARSAWVAALLNESTTASPDAKPPSPTMSISSTYWATRSLLPYVLDWRCLYCIMTLRPGR